MSETLTLHTITARDVIQTGHALGSRGRDSIVSAARAAAVANDSTYQELVVKARATITLAAATGTNNLLDELANLLEQTNDLATKLGALDAGEQTAAFSAVIHALDTQAH